MQSLEMKSPALIMDSPNRSNISYAVQVITPDPAQTFKALVKELREQKGLTERTIIYCQTIKVTTFLYSFFVSELGDETYIGNSGDPKKRTVEMFHNRIDDLNRDHILESMGKPNGSVRVLIATIACGMGIDCKNVKTVLHYGPSYNLETYLQESGRAGRSNDEMCKSVVLYSSLMMKHCSEEIKSYARETSTCRRKLLLKNFDVDFEKLPSAEPAHNCYDFCKKNCKCQGGCCDFVFFQSQLTDIQEGPTDCISRGVSDAQRGNLRQKLNYLKKALRGQYLRRVRLENVPLFTPAKLYGAFGDLHVEQICTNCENIFSVTDIFKFVDIWNLSVTLEVLFTLAKSSMMLMCVNLLKSLNTVTHQSLLIWTFLILTLRILSWLAFKKKCFILLRIAFLQPMKKSPALTLSKLKVLFNPLTHKCHDILYIFIFSC